jgi:anti-sigma B factor antagonist
MSSPQSFAIEVNDPEATEREISVRGELDMSTAPELTTALVGAGETGASSITLDLSRVTFLDSSAIGALIAAGQELSAQGRKLKIGPRSAIVSRVLEITGLTEESEAFDVLPEEG